MAARAARLTPLLLIGALTTGCGDDSSDEPATTSASGAFPVTLKHAFGSTTIPEQPKRIVAVGYNEDDFVLALGVKPVGVRDFIGTFDEDDRVWARDLYAGAKPEKVGGDELELEKVAALQPDLIMGVYSFIDEEMYEKLSQIAPTVAPTKATAADTWQDQTLITGRALGREKQAQEVVDRVEGRFAKAREEHPEFEGKTLAYALLGEGGANAYSLEATDLRTQLFTSLGFEMTESTGEISRERMSLLDEDVLVTAGLTDEQEAEVPVLPALDAVEEGRQVTLGDFSTEVNGAIGYSSPLSLSRALDLIVPQLAEAAGKEAS